MTVRLPGPRPSEFHACTATARNDGGYDIRDITDASEIRLGGLVPGHVVTVRARVWFDTAGALIVGLERRDIPAKEWTTIAITTTVHAGTLPVRMIGPTLAGMIDTYLTDQTDLGPHPRPCDVLSLQAVHPTPAGDISEALSETYDRGALFDITDWDAPVSPGALLHDVTRAVTSMSIRRGVSASGPALSAEVGTLTVRARNGLHPYELGLNPGALMILYHWPTREPVFTGDVTDLALEYDKRGGYTVELVANDAVAPLAATTRYGARPENGQNSEPWADRVHRLMKSAPQVAYKIHDPSVYFQFMTVWETSLANYLDATVNSAAGYWIVDRDNTVHIHGSRPTLPPLFEVTDAAPTNAAARRWSYTAAALQWRYSERITALTVTNHPAKMEEGRLSADDSTTTIKAETSLPGSTAYADITVSPGMIRPAITALLEQLAYPSITRFSPHDVTLYAAAPSVSDPGPLMAAAATFDPMTAVTSTANGHSIRALIRAVEHDITPSTWKSTLHLLPQKD